MSEDTATHPLPPGYIATTGYTNRKARRNQGKAAKKQQTKDKQK